MAKKKKNERGWNPQGNLHFLKEIRLVNFIRSIQMLSL